MADDTKPCPYCAETIKAAAVVCRFCGRDLAATPEREKAEPDKGGIGWRFIGVLGVAVLAIALLGAIGEGQTTPTSWATPSMAYVMTEKFVTEQLRAPATARFQGYSPDLVQNLGGGRFRITAYVDSENGFGAMIRTDFTAVVRTEDDGKTWRLESLTFD